MSGPARAAVVALVALCVLGVGGCRGDGPRAAPADPLAGIESDVAAAERDAGVRPAADR